MRAKTDKYAVFSQAFAELSEEAQDKLVDMAHRLLETHQLADEGADKREKARREGGGLKGV